MWWTYECYEYSHTSSDDRSTDYLRNYSIWPNFDCTDSRRNFGPLTGRDNFYPTSTYIFGCSHCSSSFRYCTSSVFIRLSMVACRCICISLLLFRISSFASSCFFKLLISPSDCWSLDINWSCANFSDLKATSKACDPFFSFSCSNKEGPITYSLTQRHKHTHIHSWGHAFIGKRNNIYTCTVCPKVMGIIICAAQKDQERKVAVEAGGEGTQVKVWPSSVDCGSL